MRKSIFCIICVISTAATSQMEIKPFVKAGITPCIFSNILLDEINLGAGFKFNQQFSVPLNFRVIDAVSSQLQILAVSISPTYRILDESHIVSPTIGLDVGTQLFANAKNQIISSDYSYTGYNNMKTVNISYNRATFLGKVRLLADVRIKWFNVMGGLSYNLYAFKLNMVEPVYNSQTEYQVTGSANEVRMGLGLEAAVTFTFPMTKRKAKAASGGY